MLVRYCIAFTIYNNSLRKSARSAGDHAENYARKSARSAGNTHQLFDVLPYDIKFKINNGPGTNSIKIGVLVRIGDDGNSETTVMRIETGEAYAIHGNRSFFNGDVVWFRIVFKIKTPPSIFITNRRANPCLIPMALNDVTVKTAVGNQAPFEIDAVPYLPASQN